MIRWASPAVVLVAGIAASAGCEPRLFAATAILAMFGHAVAVRRSI